MKQHPQFCILETIRKDDYEYYSFVLLIEGLVVLKTYTLERPIMLYTRLLLF